MSFVIGSIVFLLGSVLSVAYLADNGILVVLAGIVASAYIGSKIAK